MLLATASCYGAAAGTITPTRMTPTSPLLDQRTRAFASQGGDCVRRANTVWRATAKQIKADPKTYLLSVNVAVARCTLDFVVLRKRDQRGDWRMFESSARTGIGAVQGWAEG